MLAARSYSIIELQSGSGFDRRTIVYYIQQGLLPRVGRRGPNTRYPEECLYRLQFVRRVKDLQNQGELLTVTLGDIRQALAGASAAAVRDLVERGLPPGEVARLLRGAGQSPGPGSGSQTGAAAPPAEDTVLMPARPRRPPAPSADGRSYGLADASIRYKGGAAAAGIPGPGTTGPAMAPAAPTSLAAAPAVPSVPVDDLHHEDTHPRLPRLRDTLPTGSARDATAGATGQDAIPGDDLGEFLRRLELQSTLGRRRSAPGSAEQWTEIPITSRIYLSVRGLADDDMPLADGIARILKRALRGG